MINKKFDFWDVVILIGALLILFWVFLKILGIVNSPVWFDMLPYLGAGFSILGFVYKLGKIMRGIEETDNKVNRILSIENRFNKLEHEHSLFMNGKLKIKHGF